MSNRTNVALAVLGASLFGLLAGWVHGNDGGLRAEIANVVAPWLFVALIPAWRAGSSLRGAILGTMTTLVALLGYYMSLTAVMYGHLGDIHGAQSSFETVLDHNQMWFKAGLMSGPVCGAIAGFLGSRCRATWLGVALGLLMLGEAGVVIAAQDATLPVVNVGWGGSDPWVYGPEAVLGLVTLLAIAALALRLPERPVELA